jgi:hypothetical protein
LDSEAIGTDTHDFVIVVHAPGIIVKYVAAKAKRCLLNNREQITMKKITVYVGG